MTTRSSASFLRIVAITVMLIGARSLLASDFSKYTVIPDKLKSALRTNWQSKFPSSGYTSGNVAVYGNSITYTNAFWRPFAWGSPGIVPGTNLASYTVEKGTGTCAYSGYQIGDGLSCVAGANASLKPEVVICEYGTNDIRDKSIGSFGTDYGQYLDVLLDNGIIPIISTIPPMRMNGDASFEAVCSAINDTIRAVAQRKNVVLVDYWKAMMDCSVNNPFSGSWMDVDGVHPAGGCTLTDTANPQCGYGVRNAVCWHAVNKVYRIIIENGTADDGGHDSVSIVSQPHLTSSANVQITSGGQECLLFDVSGFGSTRGWIGRFYTCNGKECHILAARQTENSEIARFRWDTRTSAPGTYLVQFTNSSESTIRKVTVR